jgi:hypothetical protein
MSVYGHLLGQSKTALHFISAIQPDDFLQQGLRAEIWFIFNTVVLFC